MPSFGQGGRKVMVQAVLERNVSFPCSFKLSARRIVIILFQCQPGFLAIVRLGTIGTAQGKLRTTDEYASLLLLMLFSSPGFLTQIVPEQQRQRRTYHQSKALGLGYSGS